MYPRHDIQGRLRRTPDVIEADTHDPNRKMHLTKGTKNEAETEQNSILQAETEEMERVNLAEPVDGNLNIASS